MAAAAAKTLYCKLREVGNRNSLLIRLPSLVILLSPYPRATIFSAIYKQSD